MTTTETVTFLGNTDEVDTCDCCGRTNLKATVALETEAGAVVYYGVTCAARAIGRKVSEVKAAAKAADDAKAAAERAARDAAFRADYDRMQAWLDAVVPSQKGERLLQLEALGGYAAAKALYRAA